MIQFGGRGNGNPSNIPNSSLANMAANTVKGNPEVTSGAPEDMTIAGGLTLVPGSPGVIKSKGSISFGYLFSTNTAPSDPGPGVIKFNNATFASVTAIYIDPSAAGSRNVASLIANCGQLVFMSNDETSTVMGAFNVTGITNNSDNYYTLAGTMTASFGSRPANNEEVVVSFISALPPIITVQDLLDLDFLRIDANGDIIDGAGTVVSGLNNVTNRTDLPTASTKTGKTYIVTAPIPIPYYSDGTLWHQIGGPEPMYAWSAFLSATGVPVGTSWRIDPASFGGTYKNPLGIIMTWDGTNWRPKGGRQTMATGASTAASPLATSTGTGSDVLFNIATNFSMPAGLLSYVGIGIRVAAVFQKTGADANASTFRTKLGKNNTAGTTDIIYSIVTTAVALREAKTDQTARVTVINTATNAIDTFTTDTLQANGQGTSLVNDKNTYLDTAVVNYVVFTASGTAGATHALVSFEIELLG